MIMFYIYKNKLIQKKLYLSKDLLSEKDQKTYPNNNPNKKDK